MKSTVACLVLTASCGTACLQSSVARPPESIRTTGKTTHGSPAVGPSRLTHENFQSEPDANESFRRELLRLNAFPLIAAHHSGLGFAIESQIDQLSVVDSEGQVFPIRRLAGHASTSQRPDWKTVGLYESIPSNSVPDPNQVPNFAEVAAGGQQLVTIGIADDSRSQFRASRSATPEPPIQLYLAFTHPGAVHFESPSNIVAIPSDVTARDIVLDTNETLSKSHCRVAATSRHCVAVYATVGSDGRESRTVVALYDTNWSRIGTAARNPRSWAQDDRVLIRPFQIDHVFNVDGWDAPIFVTSESTSEYPCVEFRLHTFLTDGRFATIRVSNGVVFEDGFKHACGY
jgi:hypothetical protein